jgi:dsRNA-specific ribonuclease
MAFIGDSVLRFIIRDHLYHQYPKFPKGELTHIAAGANYVTGLEVDENYAKIAISMNIVDYMNIENQCFLTR